MAQISKGDTFANGEQVTGARLNQLVDSAVVISGAITEQSAMTANTVASNDSVLLYDLSATALRKPTVGDLLNSNIPITASTITTSVINAVANSDILITPNDSVSATGKTFSSPDGITVTVASTAHGLVTGQQVTITASVTAYSGIYRITVTNVDAFTYVLYPTTSSASGTCSYVREGTVRIAGELNTTGVLNISGSTLLAGTTRVSGALTSTGTANFTNSVQFNATPVYALYSASETPIPFGACDATTANGISTTCNQWITVATISSLTKTNKEIWEIYATTPCVYHQAAAAKVRLVTGTGTVLARADAFLQGGNTLYQYLQFSLQATILDSVILSNDSIKFEIRYNAGSPVAGAIMQVNSTAYFSNDITSKLTITKYIKP
jgi:hypothetical protein